jgi:hypothetical protein
MFLIPRRHSLIPLVILTMAAFVPGILHAQDPAAPALTTAQLDKIVAGIKERNQEMHLAPELLKLLGVNKKDDDSTTFQSYGVQDTEDLYHGFLLREGMEGYLIVQRLGDQVTTFYADPGLHLISAYAKKISQTDYSAVAADEAAKELAAELSWWAQVADRAQR